MDTAKARKHMVDSQIRPNDVPDIRIQDAMATIPREHFVPSNKQNLAYVEIDVPLFEGRYLLRARDFSKLIHAARIKQTDLILDIGCGYGYSSAVLARMGSVVVGLETDDDVIAKASANCEQAGADNVAFVKNDSLADGCPQQGPYDVIVIEGPILGGVDTLKEQLKPDGGRLAYISLETGVPKAVILTRQGDAFGERVDFEASQRDILPGFEGERVFQF